ncbi:DUF397 domain-containing protein [Catenuloplanes sp. NPDC051500]|uniref:DUF397 domain-containing protein n=1 Tax=Catenuloplanes sp. NPDC051500 TaxID=3363959 RepID=UPI0037B7C5E6
MSLNHVDIRRGFRRSQRCETANCVEVDTDRALSGRVYVRDSDEPGAVLAFAPTDWSAFLRTLRTD